jgi:Bacteriophage lambda head decoration protein D
MPEITEGRYRGEFLISEACGSRSVGDIILDTGDLVAGTVLGKIAVSVPTTGTAGANTGNGTCTGVAGRIATLIGAYLLTCIVAGVKTAGAATGAAVAGNTGTGGITASPAVGAGAKVGVYRAVCIEPATDAGKFLVSDPDGIEVGVATVGVEFVGGGLTFTIADATDFVAGDSFTITVAGVAANTGTFSVVSPSGQRLKDATVGVAYATDELAFTINDGTTDFVVGDSFTVTVAAGSGKHVQFNQDATDGSQIADGILYDNVDASAADKEAVAYLRDCEVNGEEITWPADIDAGELTTAIAQLAERGIIVR